MPLAREEAGLGVRPAVSGLNLVARRRKVFEVFTANLAKTTTFAHRYTVELHS